MPGDSRDVAPHVIGAYVGGFGTPGGDYHSAAANAYYKAHAKCWKKIPPLGAMASAHVGDGFFYNYYKAAGRS